MTTRISPLGLAVGGGAGVIAVVVAVGVLVANCRHRAPGPTARANPGAGVTAADDETNAPGTAQLRALGCQDALVADMQKRLGAAHLEEGEPRYIVTCDVSAEQNAPSCQRVAGAYFEAIGKTDANVSVRVGRIGSTSPLCARLYAPTGVDLGSL